MEEMKTLIFSFLKEAYEAMFKEEFFIKDKNQKGSQYLLTGDESTSWSIFPQGNADRCFGQLAIISSSYWHIR